MKTSKQQTLYHSINDRYECAKHNATITSENMPFWKSRAYTLLEIIDEMRRIWPALKKGN